MLRIMKDILKYGRPNPYKHIEGRLARGESVSMLELEAVIAPFFDKARNKPPGKQPIELHTLRNEIIYKYEDQIFGSHDKQVPGPLSRILDTGTFNQVSCGQEHVALLHTDGSIITWGRNKHAQCDAPAGETYVQIAASNAHNIALREDGTAIAWGCNDHGQCDVPAGETFVQVAAGYFHSIGLREDGSVIGWGDGVESQWDVPAGETFVQVDAGSGYSIGLRADGKAIAWGDNYNGQCNVPAGERFVQVAAGANRVTIGLRADGKVRQWGDDHERMVPPAGQTFNQVACGGLYNIGIRTYRGKRNYNSLVTWGGSYFEDYGQWNCPPGNTFVQADAGHGFCIALRDNGTAIAWGKVLYDPPQ